MMKLVFLGELVKVPREHISFSFRNNSL